MGMIGIAMLWLMMTGQGNIKNSQEYVSLVGGNGWIAGICAKGDPEPKCPHNAKLEWQSKKQCVYRCVTTRAQTGTSGTITLRSITLEPVEPFDVPAMPCSATEPLDVPAVEETHEEEYGTSDWCNSCSLGACTLVMCDPHATHKVTEWSCNDKHRILEHDEQEPPTYWCRKVVSQ